MTSRAVGVLGGSARARVGAHGEVDAPPVAVTWWVGADDGWHDPQADTTTRSRRPGVAPTYETAVRVPAGDFIARVYGVAAPADANVVALDFENASRAPCSVAIFVDVRERGTVRLDGNELFLDGTRLLTLAQPPRLWAAGADASEIVRSGQAGASASADTPTSWEGPEVVVLLAPVPHRTVLRTALSAEAIDVRALAPPDDVERGWDRQLDRGLRTELPDPWQTRVDHARVDVLLAPIDASTLRALEDWGFDTEAAVAWERASLRVRRAARRRSRLDDVWSALRACDPAAEPGRFLVQLRDALVRESRRAVELLPEFPVEWLGQQLAVHDLPLRTGRLSFAVRWHGARPALLWDAPPGTVLRVPGLDPEWSTTTAVGETLLAMPPAPLLAMGTARREGDRIDDPESFG